MAGNLMSAVASEEDIKAFLKYQENLKWAKEHDSKLDRFTGEFIAVANRQIVGHARSRDKLPAKVMAIAGVYVMFVSKRGLTWIL